MAHPPHTITLEEEKKRKCEPAIEAGAKLALTTTTRNVSNETPGNGHLTGHESAANSSCNIFTSN